MRGDAGQRAVRLPGHRAEPHHPASPPSQPDAGRPDAALRAWLRQWAKDHPRRGFRRAYHDARGEGWIVNHKKIQRLWREEGLRVPQRRRRKRVGTSTAPTRRWLMRRTGVGGGLPIRRHHRRPPGQDRLDR